MFGKKDSTSEKKLSSKELKKLAFQRIIGELESLAPDQSITYKVPEHCMIYQSCFLIAQLNPAYPQEGKKYLLLTDTMVGGKPSGSPARFMDTNKPADFADWVLDRSGERFI